MELSLVGRTPNREQLTAWMVNERFHVDDLRRDLKASARTARHRPILRERLELILVLVVEVLCLLLFIDFLFIGYYLE